MSYKKQAKRATVAKMSRQQLHRLIAEAAKRARA